MARLRKFALASALLALSSGAFAAGTLNVALETDARGFDAVKSGVLGASAGTISNVIHDTLLRYDAASDSYKPGLAESWSMSADNKELTVKLKKGIKFHDGTAFTAKDAAVHMNRILIPKTNRVVGRSSPPSKGLR